MTVSGGAGSSHPAGPGGAVTTATGDAAMLEAAREEAFGRLATLAAVALDVPLAAVSLAGGEPAHPTRWVGMPPGIAEALDARREASASGGRRDGAVVIPDTRRRPLPSGLHPLPSSARAYAGVPLVSASGEPLGAFYVADTVPREWTARDLDLLEVLAASALGEIELHAARTRDRSRAERLELAVHERTLMLEQVNRHLLTARRDLSCSREETIRRLAGAIEIRCGETGAHSSRMGLTCAILATRMGMDAERAALIRIASPLHDVGKIAIPDRLLEKPGPLTAPERSRIETHAQIGHHLLAGSGEPLLDLAALMALTHHERMDGGGYPRALRAGEIPIEGRIAAVADVFDALTNDRAYRPALGVEKAVELMRDGRGTQFDPEVLDAFEDGIAQIVTELGVDASAAAQVRAPSVTSSTARAGASLRARWSSSTSTG